MTEEPAPGNAHLAAPIDAGRFREAMSRVTGAVHIVTTDGPAGLGGITATAVTSITLEPPMMLFCINKTSRSAARMMKNGVFCINTLTSVDEPLSDIFAGRTHQHLDERFAAGTWTKLATGAPVLTSALVAFDCRFVGSQRSRDPSDHDRHRRGGRNRLRRRSAALRAPQIRQSDARLSGRISPARGRSASQEWPKLAALHIPIELAGPAPLEKARAALRDLIAATAWPGPRKIASLPRLAAPLAIERRPAEKFGPISPERQNAGRIDGAMKLNAEIGVRMDKADPIEARLGLLVAGEQHALIGTDRNGKAHRNSRHLPLDLDTPRGDRNMSCAGVGARIGCRGAKGLGQTAKGNRNGTRHEAVPPASLHGLLERQLEHAADLASNLA